METTITKDFRTTLKAELRRTGYDLRLLKGRRDLPDGLTVRMVRRWMLGSEPKASAQHLDFVRGLLASMPDFVSLSPSDAYVLQPKRRIKPSDGEWLAFTPEMHARFVNEISRTGAAMIDLARSGSGKLVGLTAGVLSSWHRNAVATVNPDHWAFAIQYLENLPEKVAPERKQGRLSFNRHRADYRLISDAEFVELRSHRQRTNLSGERLFLHAAAPPMGLDGSMVSAWINQQTLSASPEHIAFVLALYRSQPDAN